MERKLASVQRVLAIEPIENADNIELATVGGWGVVVKKGTFEPGMLGVYFEIDSVPPDSEEYQFLWQKQPVNGGTQVLTARPSNFRIKTKKMRGCLSQGLLLSLEECGMSGYEEGDDVTEVLGVTKYEPPVFGGHGFMGGQRKGNFPTFIPKTDEERVQNCKGALAEMQGQPYIITLKCDGTSATYAIDPETDEFLVCSRNNVVCDGDNVYWNMARKYDIELFVRRSGSGAMAIQGEICGPGIQKNRLGLQQVEFFAFNIYDLYCQKYRPVHDILEAMQGLTLTPVPIVESGESFAHTQESLLALAEGKYPGTTNEREGIVVRPLLEQYSPSLRGRLSFKAISNRFLLKESD